MSSAIEKSQTGVLAELLDLIGRENLDAPDEEEVNQILQAGVPSALKAHLDIILGAASERAKMWAADRWLDRAGVQPVQKIAVHKRISIDPATLEALKAIAREDPEAAQAVIEGVIDVGVPVAEAEQGQNCQSQETVAVADSEGSQGENA